MGPSLLLRLYVMKVVLVHFFDFPRSFSGFGCSLCDESNVPPWTRGDFRGVFNAATLAYQMSIFFSHISYSGRRTIAAKLSAMMAPIAITTYTRLGKYFVRAR